MSKTETSPAKRNAIYAISFGVIIAVLIGVGLLLREYGPGNMGIGFMQGGAISMIGLAFVLWRVHTRPHRASTFERAFTQTGDERDDAVLTRAFAFLGACAVPSTAVATVIIALGANVSMVLALLLLTQALIGSLAFVVINRRN